MSAQELKRIAGKIASLPDDVGKIDDVYPQDLAEFMERLCRLANDAEKLNIVWLSGILLGVNVSIMFKRDDDLKRLADATMENLDKLLTYLESGRRE